MICYFNKLLKFRKYRKFESARKEQDLYDNDYQESLAAWIEIWTKPRAALTFWFIAVNKLVIKLNNKVNIEHPRASFDVFVA